MGQESGVQRIDFVKTMQNMTAPGPLAAARPTPALSGGAVRAPSPPEAGSPADGPWRRRLRWFYAVADRLRSFFQAPALQRADRLTSEIQDLSRVTLEIRNELADLSRKIDAVILRAERRP